MKKEQISARDTTMGHSKGDSKYASETPSFELESNPAIWSLKKLLNGFCEGRSRTVFDEAENSLETRCVETSGETQTTEVIRDLNNVFDGNTVKEDEVSSKKTTSSGLSEAQENEATPVNTKDLTPDSPTSEISSNVSAAQKEEEAELEKQIGTDLGENRLWRILQATFVTFFVVLATLIIIHRLEGSIEITVTERGDQTEQIPSIRIQRGIEKQLVGESRRLIHAKKIIEDTILQMHQSYAEEDKHTRPDRSEQEKCEKGETVEEMIQSEKEL